ncbi:Gfo/Idh/MocA family oxidoreductase [Ravibacter arvi]|uniref:Gfo/Idh/MocA family oxidoreductase n=1 Tax=Ravibacter arvi TaxID=2051041 RepID=A0ABP8LQG7_9BACT
MTKRVYGIGIIGTGLIADFHAKAIREIPNARLVGAFNRNQAKAADFVSRFGGKTYASQEELAEDEEIDVVCICTASGAHLEGGLAAIRAGKHCLIEKPMEITSGRCDQLISAAAEAGVHLGVIFPSRYHEVNINIKAAIDARRIGTPVIGNAYVKWNRSKAYYQSAPWRGTWELDGGGALMNQGIHSVDLLQWFMGPVETVHAFAANRRHTEIEVEDTLVAILKFSNGALGTIECSTASYPGSFKRLEVIGTEGTAIGEENDLLTWAFEHELPEDESIREKYSGKQLSKGGVADPAAISFIGHQRQIEDFLEAIDRGGEPGVNGIEGRKSVAIIEAIYESARTGQSVRLPHRQD